MDLMLSYSDLSKVSLSIFSNHIASTGSLIDYQSTFSLSNFLMKPIHQYFPAIKILHYAVNLLDATMYVCIHINVRITCTTFKGKYFYKYLCTYVFYLRIPVEPKDI